MQNIYLLQPLTRKTPDNEKQGFDRYFRVESVGYAEYEFGTFPRILKATRANGIATTSFEVNGFGLVRQTVHLVGDKDAVHGWADAFAAWAPTHYTKGVTRFWDALEEEGKKHQLVERDRWQRVDNVADRAWFDLNNGVAVTLNLELVPVLMAAFEKK